MGQVGMRWLGIWGLPLIFGGSAWAGSGAAALDLSAVVEKVLPGVVNIRTLDVGSAGGGDANANIFDLFSVPQMMMGANAPRSLGTGFFAGPKNLVWTNWHVVEDAESIFVIAANGKKNRGRIIGKDIRRDVALLQVVGEIPEHVALKFGKSDALKLGEMVFAIGNPFGFGHTVTSGILSARGRSLGSGPLSELLQTDASINPGNSGGPLFNGRGEVVGMNVAQAKGAQGISFAIPSELLEVVGQEILGKAPKGGWVGVVWEGVPSDGGSLGRSGEAPHWLGVKVVQVIPGSPASRAGLRTGDILTRAEGKELGTGLQWAVWWRQLAPGQTVRVTVFRAGVGAQEVVLLPEDMPPSLLNTGMGKGGEGGGAQ